MQFSRFFPWWIAALGLAVAAVIIVYTYRKVDKPLSRRLRATLIGLRMASVLIILICLLEPTLIARQEVQRKANLLVLVDDSQSMSLNDVAVSDQAEGIPRIDAIKEAFARSGVMESLADKFKVQLYQFSSDCAQVENLDLTSEGTLTDTGRAFAKASDDWRGQFTAGIVLVTDGGNNTGSSPVDSARQTGLPIYTVGVGSTEMPRDIQVAKVEVSPIAYTEHILPVRAVIKSSGYDGQEVPVSLMQDDELKDSVPLKLDSQNGEQFVDLQLKPQQEGTFSFSVIVPAAPEELTDQNNKYPFFVKVVKTKLKVLYIDGRPRWEHTFLKRALERDPNIEPTCMVVAEKADADAPVQAPKFPGTRNELSSYDILILGDMDPRFFSTTQLNMINDFVEDRGKSLVFLGGKHSLGSGGFGASILRGMLPIQIGPGGARRVEGAFNPVLTTDGLRHAVTRLSDDQNENVSIWRDLPALPRFYMGAGIKLGATVLAEHQRERAQPVIAFQRYGSGIVLVITSDSLWRWAFGAYPFGGDDSHYRRFWSGTIRWLASAGTQADLVSVETDKGSYYRDEKVGITVYVYDESYAPVNDAQLRGQVEAPAEPGSEASRLPISGFTSNGNGRYSAEFTPTGDGHYKLEVSAYYAGGLLGKASAEFVVQAAILEFQDTQLKESFLTNLADISGGSYHHLDDISSLPSSIREVSDTYAFIRERGLWDNGIMLIIAVALLSTEWLLRKRKGLV
jgi:uncharacterized membrane protein